MAPYDGHAPGLIPLHRQSGAMGTHFSRSASQSHRTAVSPGSTVPKDRAFSIVGEETGAYHHGQSARQGSNRAAASKMRLDVSTKRRICGTLVLFIGSLQAQLLLTAQERFQLYLTDRG